MPWLSVPLLAAALVVWPQRVEPMRRVPTTRLRANEPLQQLAMVATDIPVDIAVTGMNSRCISASIVVNASPAQIWSIISGAPAPSRRHLSRVPSHDHDDAQRLPLTPGCLAP